jgi:hypothetical protein
MQTLCENVGTELFYIFSYGVILSRLHCILYKPPLIQLLCYFTPHTLTEMDS